MKIALLGGSFDPPHLGHYLIAQQILEFVGVEQVWLLPMYSTGAHDKIFQKNMSAVQDRVAMAKLLEDDKIKVSDFEIKYNQKSITIVTLERLTKNYPEHTFYWITGGDKLDNFRKYDRWEDIVTKHNLIIFPREWILPKFEEKVKETLQLKTIPQNVIVMQQKELVLTNISSTIIRERIRKHLPIHFLIHSSVEAYIKEHNLYQK